jgi:hypothetical protein
MTILGGISDVASGISDVVFPHTDAHALQEEFDARGVAVIPGPALDASLWEGLCAEARQQRTNGAWRLEAAHVMGEISQDNIRGHLGPIARTLLASDDTRRLLREVTRLDLEPSWSASCYTYYDVPGAYLGEHCDKFDACRVAMLVYLMADWPSNQLPGAGLQLEVFAGDSSRSPLVARITSRTNRIVILNGSRQAHRRAALAAGESLTLLAGCFRLAGDATV